MKTETTLFRSNPDKCDSAYTYLLNSSRQHVREHIDRLWEWYSEAGLPDAHFLSEFPLQTGKRLWELETAWFLHNSAFALSNRKAGADFHCVSEGHTFEVDAVAPGPGASGHPDVVNEVPLLGDGPFRCSETIYIPERERIELLRLTNVIDTKAKKHVCDIRKGASDPSLPFVIALSVTDMHMLISDWDMPAVLKAVFQIGGQYYDCDPSTGKVLRRRWQCRPQLKKGTESMAPISTRIFCPGMGAAHHREISAILYSELDFRNRDYPYSPEEHCRHFALIHNADCSKPFPRGSLTVGTEYWIEEAGDNEYALCETKLK